MAIIGAPQSSMELLFPGTYDEKKDGSDPEKLDEHRFDATLTNRPFLSLDEFKRGITQLFRPRVVILRVKYVLAALLPLFNLADDGSFGLVLNGLSYGLSALGWALHGIRLLINTVRLLQHTIPGDGMSDSDEGLRSRKRFDIEFSRTWIEFGTDFIWIFSGFAPATLSFTVGALIADLVWVVFRAWIEIDCLISNRSDQKNLPKKIAYEQQKLMLNLGQLLLMSTVIMLKSFVLPALMPVLATNPFVLLIGALLMLAITFMNQYSSQHLPNQKPPECIEERRDTRPTTFKSSDTFFAPTPKSPTEPLNELEPLML